MKQTTIVSVILGVLVIISLVQAFQLNELDEKVSKGGQLAIKSSSQTTTTASAPSESKKVSSLPSSIKDLPTMVGGC